MPPKRRRAHIKVEVESIPASNTTFSAAASDIVDIAKLEVVKTSSTTTSIATTVETRPTKKRKVILPNKTPINRDPPKDWKVVYDLIKAYRDMNLAAVDTMGCERLGERTSEKIFRFQTLMALMLSSQTKDEITAQAMSNLKSHEPGGLTVDSILQMDAKTLDTYICKVGFHNRKTTYIKQAAQILEDKYDGDIPPTVDELMELPGVGPKMAYLCMQCAWKKNDGIGVDTHVHRISNRLGWVKTAVKDPELTRLELESWLPKEYWAEVNSMLVGFGQILCKPVKPNCAACPVKDLCPKIGTKSAKSS